MNCRSAEHLFSSFLEEELSQRERRTLESHLEGCPRCSTAIEELRTTVDFLGSLPSYETSPAFEEEIMDRIRSGEALRPTLIEWIQELVTPARIRPFFLAGAAGCAVWVAVLIANPSNRTSGSLVAERTSSGVAGTSESAIPSFLGPSLVPAETASDRSREETIATGPKPAPSAAKSGEASVADRTSSSSALTRESSPAGSGESYQDEYILDQFYLNRSSEDGVHSIVPVTGRASDDVYIMF